MKMDWSMSMKEEDLNPKKKDSLRRRGGLVNADEGGLVNIDEGKLVDANEGKRPQH